MISDRESFFVRLLALWSNWPPPSGVAPNIESRGSQDRVDITP